LKDLNKKIFKATFWSSLSEILSKIISPVTTIILARLLTPEAFGVIATITMIISFTQIFSDAGFQKFIIQHEFQNKVEKYKFVNVAFITNLIFSFSLWLIIIINSEYLALITGAKGLGIAISVACVSIPISGFSSIHMALYKRELDFKTLFNVRLVGICIPFLITIPLAYLLKSYWALIAGTIITNLVNAIILTYFSRWKPKFFYDFYYLKKMFSFSSWLLLDAVLIWFTLYIDIFLIGLKFNDYLLGLYKTSIALVGQIIAIITSTIVPIILPALSRLQNNIKELKNTLLEFQLNMGIILIPLGFGIFLFRDLIVSIFLGNQWMEASELLGLWGAISAIVIIFSRFGSMVYPAIGKPRYSVLAQILHLIVLVPVIIYFSEFGFRELYISRTLIRFELVIVNLIIVYLLINLSPLKMLKNLIPIIFSTIIMFVSASIILKFGSSTNFQFLAVFLSMVIYFSVLSQFGREKKKLETVFNTLIHKLKR
tara:strand:+ start:1424 stop:2881 length:1458 start_codon:yes stop_codon:yes gene_type:complete